MSAAVEALLSAEVPAQQAVFCKVARRARRRGLGDVIDSWGADVAAFRGS